MFSDSATPWTAAGQASLSFIISWSLLKFMSIESVLPSNDLLLCCPLLLLPSVFPRIGVLSKCTPPSTLFRLSRASFLWLFHFPPAPGFLILRVCTHPVQHPLSLDSSGSSPEPFTSRQSAPPSLHQPPHSYEVNLGPPETLELTPVALRGRLDRGPRLVSGGLGQPDEKSGRRHLASLPPCLIPPSIPAESSSSAAASSTSSVSTHLFFLVGFLGLPEARPLGTRQAGVSLQRQVRTDGTWTPDGSTTAPQCVLG